MDQGLLRLAAALDAYVRSEASRSPEGRELLAALGEWLTARAGGGAVGAEAPARALEPKVSPTAVAEGAPAAVAPQERAGPLRLVEPRQSSAGWVPLRIGDAEVHVPVAGTTSEIGRARQAAAREDGEAPARRAVDLALISRRCKLKAESCRAVIDRRAATDGAALEEVEARIRDLLANKDELPDCFLWALYPERTPPGDAALAEVETCYDAAASACEVMGKIESSAGDATRPDLEEAMQLMATASSALRSALERTWLTRPDIDQDEMHAWLRYETHVQRVFVHRHMKLEDPAGVEDARRVIEQAEELKRRIEKRRHDRKAAAQQLNKIAYQVKKYFQGPVVADERERRTLLRALEELERLGIGMGDARVREALAGASTEAFGPDAEVVRAALAPPRAAGEEEEPEAGPRWSESVLRVRQWLKGTTVVMIGGERMPAQEARIREAFDLGAVEWPALTEHGSGEYMRAPIQRPETSLVVILIRLTGHLHGDEAREYAAAAGKPYVLIRAGHNPEQIAEAVLDQAGEQFAMKAERTSA